MSNKGKSSETRYLKSVFGEDWKKGMRENPHIDKVQDGYADRAKSKMIREKEQRVNKVLTEGVLEAKAKGQISAQKASNMLKAIE